MRAPSAIMSASLSITSACVVSEDLAEGERVSDGDSIEIVFDILEAQLIARDRRHESVASLEIVHWTACK